MNNAMIQGYRRENGRVGVRNHITILPVDALSNNVAMKIAQIAHGAEALVHPFGKLQFGQELDLFFQTMIGIGSNPNVAAAIVIGCEPDWTNKVAEGIAATGKPVKSFYIEGTGDLLTIEKATRQTIQFIQQAGELQKESIDVSELVISTKCGESDTTNGLASNPVVGNVIERLLKSGATVMFGETSELTGAEQIIADRFKSGEEKEKFWNVYREYVGFIEEQHAHLLGSQPTQGNIHGGLTTIEEKAFGNIKKIGNAMIDGVLDYAESPPRSGLWFMNSSSASSEVLTLFAAAGSVIHLFPTGQGNVVGNPLMPVIKLTGNRLTASTMSEHIDLDVSKLLTQEITVEEAGDKLMNLFIRTINGRFTVSEVLGHREFLPMKLHRNA